MLLIDPVSISTWYVNYNKVGRFMNFRCGVGCINASNSLVYFRHDSIARAGEYSVLRSIEDKRSVSLGIMIPEPDGRLSLLREVWKLRLVRNETTDHAVHRISDYIDTGRLRSSERFMDSLY